MSVRVTKLTKLQRETLVELGLACLSYAGALDLGLLLGSKIKSEVEEDTLRDLLSSFRSFFSSEDLREESKKKETKAKKEESWQVEYKSFLRRWGELLPDKPQVRATTKSYQKQFKARWQDPDFRLDWDRSLQLLAQSISWQEGSYYTVEFFLRDGQSGPHWRRGIDNFYRTPDEKLAWLQEKRDEEAEPQVIR